MGTAESFELDQDVLPLRVSAACHPESDRTGVRRNVDAEAPDPGVSAPDVER
jgi:hypothetical protein